MSYNTLCLHGMLYEGKVPNALHGDIWITLPSGKSKVPPCTHLLAIPTAITGLCCSASVHSDVVFWSFDVSSSYHFEAEFTKC